LRIKNIGICGIYKSPKTNQMLLKKEFEKINLKSIIECFDDFFVVGDFNFNLNKNEGQDLINSLNLIDVMNKESVTDQNTKIDWILSKNKEGFICGVYESYFSYHKPLWINLMNFENDNENIIGKTYSILKKSDTQMSIHYTDYKINDSDSSSDDFNVSKTNLNVLNNLLFNVDIITSNDINEFMSDLDINFCLNLIETQTKTITMLQNIFLNKTKIREYYIIHTSSNGNCLWNAISLALFGNENNYIILRILTYYMFLLNEIQFNLLIKRF
jgi:hypothetical protein